MIPIIVPIIASSDKDHGGRRPSVFGILLSVIILSIGMFLAVFLLLTGKISSPMTIISIVVILIVLAMGLLVLAVLGSSTSSHDSEREEFRRGQPPIKDHRRHSHEKEYCPECGTLVDFSDNFCTTCGSRLQRWK